jgi:drug/metabolite transporter (DMT)-like permease
LFLSGDAICQTVRSNVNSNANSNVGSNGNGNLQQAARGFGFGDAMALLLVVIWGVNMPVSKQTLIDLLPMSFNSTRFVVASLLLLGVLRLMGEDWRIRRQDLPRFIMLAIVGITVYQLCFVFGLSLSTASNTSLLLATSPTLIVIFSAVLGHERASARTWLGVVLSLTGIVLVIGGRRQGLHFSLRSLEGDILAMGCAVTWALYTIYGQPLFKTYSAIKVTTVTMAMGAVPLAILAAPSLLQQNWGAVSAPAWAGLAYSTLMSIALGYVIYYTSVRLLGGRRATAYYNLTPVVSVAVAFAFLGERLTLAQAVGAVIVLFGVYLTRRSE